VTAFVLNSTHKATMEILVNSQRVDPTVSSQSTQGQAAAPFVTDYDMGSEVELLKSPALLEAVVRANHLQENEKKSITAFLHRGADESWYVARAAAKLAGRLEITAVPKSDLIQVSCKSANPQQAYNVLQTLSKLYLAQHLAIRRPQGAYAFFAAQAEKYQQALADSVARSEEFSKTSGVAAPDLERTNLAQQVTNAMGALESARQTIAADRRRIEDETVRMRAIPERSLAGQTTQGATTLMQQLEGELLNEEIKKTQLMMKYEPDYPLVQEAEQEIEKTKTAIVSASKEQFVSQTTDRDPTAELLREDVSRTQADLAFHQAAAGALESSIHSLQMQMVNLDQMSLRQADLNRDIKANETNYLLYLSKREQERTSDALDEKRIANVAIAVPPTVPVLPLVGPFLVVFCGVFLAGFLSTGATFVAEYLNPAIRTPADVMDVLSIPVLASVPKQTA